MKKDHQSGFTLYELMITVLVIGVVLALGVPNMQQFTANSRLSTATNDLHSSFLLARSEAARARDNITICASNNSMSTTPNCAGSLEDGWIIFVDTNGDIVRDAGESVLRAHPAINTGITINAAGNATYFSFAPTGLGRGNVGTGPAFVSATICDSRGNVLSPGGRSAARALVVTPIGRANVISDVTQVQAQGGCP